MKCSICDIEIKGNYCSNCGQHNNSHKLTFFQLIVDGFSNILALDGKLWNNIKTIFANPKKYVTNYWNGFRGYFYSPFRFFMVALLALAIHFYFANSFLMIEISSNGVSKQFALLTLFIILISVSSFITYILEKRTFAEHLVLTTYSVSLWTIIFVPISILLESADYEGFESALLLFFLLLIMLWNNRTFDMKLYRRILYVFLHISVTMLIIVGLYFSLYSLEIININ
ncbi:MAG TPA: hypothetical protein DIU39_00370 [Flavobacteriales bacterium]|nr:hypothetical protein [Flavobacteriales bacterium]|tara:strand:+ start:27712 stop:28395 length:684 start_codon:yes stop_codon:yes gene_type:complete